MADIIKSYNDVPRRNVDMGDGTYAEAVSSVSNNITTKLRDAFEAYTPGDTWSETKASGDLVYVDGNTAGTSYLVISKDPLTAGTETSITSTVSFTIPVEVNFGASLSQRTLGQEFSIEFVDTGTPYFVSDAEIFSISQTGTTLTVETVLPNDLSVGDCIGIRDCSDQLANYPALVVATVDSPTQFTVTAGPNGTIPSQTISNPAGAKGFVYARPRLGNASNGFSEIFESATSTNASCYVQSGNGTSLPSGTLNGNHSTPVSTTVGTQLVNSAYQYAWVSATETRFLIQQEKLQISDGAVDSTGQATSRLVRTQVCLDPSLLYKFRIRATNNKSLTVPNAKIVSAAKTGTTTATVVTNVPHGLVTGDSIVAYGPRNQTDFANLTTATAVTVVNETSFTITWGAAVTATTYGGYIAKVQGGNLMSALGAVDQVVSTAQLSTLSGGTRQLTLVSTGTWAGVSIGDLVNVIGCREATAGASLGVDGAWKVANLATTTLTLVLPYTNSMALPVDFGATNAGGAIIKRTDLRMSFVRVFDYERERVEFLARPSGDQSSSLNVVVAGGNIGATVQGTQNNNSSTLPNPILTSIVARSANPIAGAASRQQQVIGTLIGVPISKPYSIPEQEWFYAAAASGIVNTTTAVTIKTAAGAGIRNYITSIQVMAETLTNATELVIRDGAGGTVIWRTRIPTEGLMTSSFSFPCPLKGTANTILEVQTLTASGAGAVYFNAQGYAAP